MRRARIAGVLALIAAAVVAWASVGDPPPLPTPEGTVGDIFGINEAVSLPVRPLGSMTREERTFALQTRADLVRALGVRHVRVHSASYPFLSAVPASHVEPAERDEFFAILAAAELEPLVMIGPWPGNRTAAYTRQYRPNDEGSYRAWVQATVERYDGDGINDAPHIGRGVRVWEIDNEPDLHATTPPRGAPRDAPVAFGPPSEYAEVAGWTLAAIRAADAGAIVLPAGLWSAAGPRTGGYAEALWSIPTFASAFPQANVHAYPRGTAPLWAEVDAVAAMAPRRPTWITEFSVSDEAGEDAQARALVEAVLDGLARGTPRLYWHSLIEPPLVIEPRPGPHPTLGHHLYRARPDAEPKLAAEAIRAFLGRWGSAPRADVRSLASGDGHRLRIGADVLYWGRSTPPPVGSQPIVDGLAERGPWWRLEPPP